MPTSFFHVLTVSSLCALIAAGAAFADYLSDPIVRVSAAAVVSTLIPPPGAVSTSSSLRLQRVMDPLH